MNKQIYQLTQSRHELIAKEKQREQKRISEELHDGILRKLFGLRMLVGFKNIDNNISANDVEQMVLELATIEKIKSEKCLIG